MMLKRLVSVLLILSIIVGFIFFSNKTREVKADNLPYFYNESNQEYFNSIKNQLPTGTFEKIGGRPFNYKLWREKGIAVYGDYTYVPSNIQDFKTTADGYYTKGNQKGEYRYHGYNGSGSLYTNNDFPDDATSNRSMDQKYWIRNPWDSSYINNKPNKSAFNAAADSNPNNKANQLFKLNFTPQYYFHNGNFYSGSVAVKDIMNIQTAPSKNNAGEGVIWHRTRNNKTWYDTQKIDPFKAEPQPATCSAVPPAQPVKVPIKTNNPSEDNKIKNQSISFDIEVTGTYPDTAYVNDPVQKTLEYTRYDIKQWILTLNIAGQTIVKSGNEVQMLDSGVKGKHKFRVTLSVETIWNNNYLVNEKIPFTANAKCEFNTIYDDKKYSYEGGAAGNVLLQKQYSTDIDFIVSAESNPEHNSVINVDGTQNKTVTVDVTGEVLRYTNASNIKEYEFFIGKDNVQNKIGEKVTVSALACMKSKTFIIDKSKFVEGQVYSFEIPIIVNVYLKTAVQGKTKLTGQTTLVVHFNRNGPPPQPDKPFEFPPYHILDMVNPNPSLTDIWFDVEPYPCSDNTDMSKVKSAYVNVGGQTVDYNTFFSGSYVFNRTGWIDVQVNYMSNDDFPAFYATQVYMYDTTPKANILTSSKMKEKRKIVFTADVASATPAAVLDRYPLTSYSWSLSAVEGVTSSDIKISGGTNLNTLTALFMSPGTYKATLTVSNRVGKFSTTEYVFFIVPDYEPTAFILFNESVLLRGQQLTTYEFSKSSLDGDIIASTKLELWYDSNNNGIVDTKLNEWNNPVSLPNITPTLLGNYQLKYTVVEEFGEETIPAFVPAGQYRKSITKTYDFWCDNAVPFTGVYIDKPVVRPVVDVMFLLDKNLDDSKRNYIKNNRVNIENQLRMGNLDINICNWDMKTYIDSYTYSTSYDTDSMYPSSSVTVSLGDGYSGTLYRTSVSEFNRTGTRWVDKWVTETRTFTHTVQNWRPVTVFLGSGGNKYVSYGDWVLPQHGMSWPINEDGYSGNIPAVRVDYSPTHEEFVNAPVGSYTQTATKYFQGDLSKEVYKQVEEGYTYTAYIGYYSGTVSKSVRQGYNQAVNFRPTSEKYLVYVSNDVVNEISELNYARVYSDAKLTLIGNDSIKTQVSGYDKHIDNYGYQTAEELISELTNYLNERYKNISQNTVLAGEAFNILTDDSDHENDTLINGQFAYTHEPGYYDNSYDYETGCVPFGDYTSKGTLNWGTTKKNVFNKPGEYRIYRRIQDRPSTHPNFGNFSYWSGEHYMIMYAHRKPIADAFLDWDYDVSSGGYKTTWVDKSYDLDHQYTRADKGIIDRKIMYKRTKDRFGNPVISDWVYKIPDNLDPGAYDVYYYVKDVEGVWSDPWVRTIVLPDVVPLQLLNAQIRSRAQFSIGSSVYGGIDSVVQGSDTRSKRIPAAENITLYNIKTRSPYAVSLEVKIYNSSGAQAGSTITRSFTQGVTGNKTGNDITWFNFNVQIPADFADGNYRIRISCIDSYSQVQYKDFWIKVFTPVELVPDMPASVFSGEQISIRASTSVYANNTTVQLFRGTAYQTAHINMSCFSQTDGKQWGLNYTIPSNIPDGAYTAYYTATLPSGKTETKAAIFSLESLKITDLSIEGFWNHWRGQSDMFGKALSNEPHRFLSYEKVKIRVNTTGYADKVVIRFSPQLEAMIFNNHLGHTYKYKDFTGYEVNFPQDSTFILDPTNKESSVYWEYILPLAPSTKSWENTLLRQPYKMIITAYKGAKQETKIIDDIHITGNVYDLVYIQPQ